MHFGDSIFIFLLALVLFGPKKLPEIGRTIGKLLAEFRRASNEFKFQIQEELRNMEEDERRKKLAEAQAQKAAAESGTEAQPAAENPAALGSPTILPPSTGTPVSAGTPYATPVEPEPVAETIEPSAAEVVVEPGAASESFSAPNAGTEPPAPLDSGAQSNGSHSEAHEGEPAPTRVSGETIHHG